MTVLTAIAAAFPHEPGCPGDHGKCTCGTTAKRNVAYLRVQRHMSRLTEGRMFTK